MKRKSSEPDHEQKKEKEQKSSAVQSQDPGPLSVSCEFISFLNEEDRKEWITRCKREIPLRATSFPVAGTSNFGPCHLCGNQGSNFFTNQFSWFTADPGTYGCYLNDGSVPLDPAIESLAQLSFQYWHIQRHGLYAPQKLVDRKLLLPLVAPGCSAGILIRYTLIRCRPHSSLLTLVYSFDGRASHAEVSLDLVRALNPKEFTSLRDLFDPELVQMIDSHEKNENLKTFWNYCSMGS